MKVVIMAGGRGTRISSVAQDIPKPMIKIDGKPILEHEIECLRSQGFTDIIMTIGYLGDIIKNYFGDGSGLSPVTGNPFNVNISYYYEKEPLGNAGALFKLKKELTDDFILINADSIFDVDIKRFVEFHKENGGIATLFAHPNSHPYDSGLLIVNKDNEVISWLTKEDSRPEFYSNCVNAGLHVLSPEILDINITTQKIDLDRQILKPLAGTGKLFAYRSPEYVKDMGTPERYNAVCKDFFNGKIKIRNLLNKQKAIFLDRDGTINRYVGFLKDIRDFELIPGVSTAINEINNSEYLTIVITNQPVIARGNISLEELGMIHKKMETLLGNEGTYLDDIYYCPHHPHKGFEGERPEFKIDCNCRKPKPGLLVEAAKKYNIELSKSWMIGDSKNDVLAGKNAGCHTAFIGTEDFGQEMTVNSLLEFVNKIIENERNDTISE